MVATVLERTGEQISETFGKATRATNRLGGALNTRFEEAKRMARRSAQTAEEFIDESRMHIKRHPVAAVTGSFVVGLGLGVLLGWSLRKK